MKGNQIQKTMIKNTGIFSIVKQQKIKRGVFNIMGGEIDDTFRNFIYRPFHKSLPKSSVNLL